jgi:translocation and assembly module TamB
MLRVVVSVVGILTLCTVLILFVLGTPLASAWLIDSLADFSGEQFAVTGVRGTLLAGLDVDRIVVKAGRTTVVVEPARLRMNWPDLLRRRIRLTTAEAGMLDINIAPRPPDEPASVVEALRLPVVIAVDGLEVRKLRVRNADSAPVEIGPIRLRAEFVDGDVRFDSLQAELYGIAGEAAGVFGTGEPFPLTARLDWNLAGAAVSGGGQVQGSLAQLRFEQVVRLPTPVGVGGVARLFGGDPGIVGEARWTDLQRTLASDSDLVLRSDKGTLKVRGWTDRLVVDLNAGVQLKDWPRARLRVRADGSLKQLRLHDLKLDGFGGRVVGSGRVSLGAEGSSAVRGSLRLTGQGIDPGFLDPRLAGQVGFGADFSFDSGGNFRLRVPDASGTLFDRPLEASGVVARENAVLVFDDVRVNAGLNRVNFSGSLGERLVGRFRVDAPDLATLLPGYEGQVRGSGEIGGTVERPTLAVDLDGSGLAAGDFALQSLRARGGLGERDRLDIELAADGLKWAGEPLGDLRAGVTGQRSAHAVRVSLSGGKVGVALGGDGSWQRGVLTETIDAGQVTVPESQPWSLREAATAQLDGTALEVSDHCWTSNGAAICLSGVHSDARGFGGGLDVRGFPLASLAPWLPDDVGLDGTASTVVNIQRDGSRLSGSLEGGLQDGVVTWRVPDDEDVQTSISEFSVRAALTDDALDFDAVVAESFGLRLTAAGSVRQPFSDEPTIAARIGGGVPDLKSLGPLVERLVEVGDLRGRITVDAMLSGRVHQPDISGGLQLDDGALTVPAAGITVDRISLSLTGREDGQVALEGGARSGKGFVALKGSLAWRDRVLPTGEATVKGRVIDVIRVPEGLVQVSPDVRVVLRDGQFRVSGDVLVPRAQIKLKKIEESAVQPSPDTVVHGRDIAAAEKKPPLFMLDGLQVRLGERVSFDGFGLKTSLTGGLRLSQSLEADPGLVTAAGVVSLREGQFTGFGQKLAIQRGSLLFSGIVTDPGLDVKASRDVTYEGRDVTVGVLLSGKLSAIQTTIFSEPAMGELDALSYLTTGKPLSAAGAGDRSSVSSAAISLGLNQALPVVQQIGSALNVDEIAVDTNEAGGTAVVIGEQLGNNLFIRYSYGVFDDLGTVKATYKLGRRLSIEGSSGAEQSLDLIYSINW